MKTVVLTGRSLTPAQVAAVAAGAPVRLSDEAREAMRASSEDAPDVLEETLRWLVGPGAERAGAEDRLAAFVLGHCAGVGAPLPEPQVRAMMLCRANVLAAGFSGCRPIAADILIAMLNLSVHPVVPSQGSVGAAGDLAPLAHVARVACRLGGEALREGERLPADLAMAGLPRFAPTPKEALSLINGATLSAALAALACHRARRLLGTCEAALAMSMEVGLADPGCLDDALLRARRHPGAVLCAERIRGRLEGSVLVREGRAPDDFSLRCAPAVLGAAWEALEYVETTVLRELNGACDNPLVLDGRRVWGGNFHGAPVGVAMDHLKIVMTQVASMAERRLYRMTHGQLSGKRAGGRTSGGLPSFLIESTGLNSGFMLAQYTAASLVSECKGLCHPASVDSIPTGEHHEDHVSMAPIAARTALAVLENVAEVLAIEVLVAAQGLEFRRDGTSYSGGERVAGEPVALAPGIEALRRRVREVAPRWEDDRVMHVDQQAVARLVRSGALLGDPAPW